MAQGHYTGRHHDGRRDGRRKQGDLRGFNLPEQAEVQAAVDDDRAGFLQYKKNTSRPKGPRPGSVRPAAPPQRQPDITRRRGPAPASADRARGPGRKSSVQSLRPAHNARPAQEQRNSHRTRSPRAKGRGRSRPAEKTRTHDSQEQIRRRLSRGQPSCVSTANSVPLRTKWTVKVPVVQQFPYTVLLGKVGPAFTVVQIASEDVSNW